MPEAEFSSPILLDDLDGLLDSSLDEAPPEFSLLATEPERMEEARIQLRQEMRTCCQGLAQAVRSVELARSALRRAKSQAMLDAVALARERGEKPTVNVLEAQAGVSPMISRAEEHLANVICARQLLYGQWEELHIQGACLPVMMRRATVIQEIESWY